MAFTDVNATKPCLCGGTMIVKRDFSLPQMDSNPPIWAFNWFCLDVFVGEGDEARMETNRWEGMDLHLLLR